MRRPSRSRHVPKFSMWRSPMAKTLGAAKKGEGRLCHLHMLRSQVFRDERRPLAQPPFVGCGRFDDVHHFFSANRTKANARATMIGPTKTPTKPKSGTPPRTP